jgi:hypothetical protein
VSVRVSDEDEDAVDRSDPVIADATSRICRALWKNEGFRAADFVYGDLPATPSRAALDLFLRGRSWNASTNASVQPAPRLFACRAGQVRAVGKQDDQ